MCLLVPRVEAAPPLLQCERSAGIWRSLHLRLELVHERDESVRDCILDVGLERGVRRRNVPLVLRQPRQHLLRLDQSDPISAYARPESAISRWSRALTGRVKAVSNASLARVVENEDIAPNPAKLRALVSKNEEESKMTRRHKATRNSETLSYEIPHL